MMFHERRRFLSIAVAALLMSAIACATTVSPTPLSTEEPEVPSAVTPDPEVDVPGDVAYTGGLAACVQFWNTMAALRRGGRMDLVLHMTLLEIQEKTSEAEPALRSAAAVIVRGSAEGEINILENGANGLTNACLELNYLP